eukprot:scaffold11932_cov64-Phaeocystis_antarctica.AAC.2
MAASAAHSASPSLERCAWCVQHMHGAEMQGVYSMHAFTCAIPAVHASALLQPPAPPTPPPPSLSPAPPPPPPSPAAGLLGPSLPPSGLMPAIGCDGWVYSREGQALGSVRYIG